MIDFHIGKKTVGEASLKSWKNKTINLEFYTQQKYLSKNGERCFQIYKSWKNSLLAHLYYKKCQKNYFRQKENETRQKSRSIQRKSTRNGDYTWLNIWLCYFFTLYSITDSLNKNTHNEVWSFNICKSKMYDNSTSRRGEMKTKARIPRMPEWKR